MSDPHVEEQLLGHLLGALDSAEEEQVVARVRTDPELRRELARVREWLEPLEAGREDFDPPVGLAERTCRAVALEVESAAAVRRRPMNPVAAAPDSAGRFRWVDVAAAAGVFAAASLLLLPAIQSSRFNAQLLACQDNLRQVGVGMIGYTWYHNGYFPGATASGRLSAAGLCGPILVRDGLVADGRVFVCPASPLAGRAGFRMPLFEELQAASQDKLEGLIRLAGGSYGFPLGHIHDGIYQGPKNLGRGYFAIVADVPGSDPSNGRQSLNHGGRGENVLFECGAVRFVTSSRPFPQADDFYVNDFGLVGPGAHLDDSVVGPSEARLGAMPIEQ
jgi:hypothetical protein